MKRFTKRRRYSKKKRVRRSRKPSFLNKLRDAGPIGCVKWTNTGVISALGGQQEMISIPLSCTQDEVRSFVDNTGPGGRTTGGLTEVVHDANDLTVSTSVEFDTATLAGLSVIKKEKVYNFNTFRSIRFKNPANMDCEVVFHLVTCIKDLPAAMFPSQLGAGTYGKAIEILCKNDATWAAPGRGGPLAEYGRNNTAANSTTVNSSTGIAAADLVDEKGMDVDVNDYSATAKANVSDAFRNWARIGFSPKEVAEFRTYFKIKRSKKMKLASNQVVDYKFSQKKMQGIDTATLALTGRDAIRSLHTRRGQQFLVVVVRGFPCVMKIDSATYTTWVANNKDAWSYNHTTDGFAQTEIGAAAGYDVVSTSPAQLLYVANCSTNFGSLSKSTSKIRTIENVLPSVYNNSLATFNEIAEDSETVSKYKSAFA